MWGRRPKTAIEKLRKAYLHSPYSSKKLTYAFFAEKLGVNEKTVKRWIKGETKPSRAKAIKIGHFLSRFNLK